MKVAKYIALILVVAAFGLAIVRAYDHEQAIDCGPDGKPALNGTVCIDKEPVTAP
jgi:hypothetical protein